MVSDIAMVFDQGSDLLRRIVSFGSTRKQVPDDVQ